MTLSPRILLAWEVGTGRGHVTTLKTIAHALGDGFVYDAALCHMTFADDLAPLCELVFPGSALYLSPIRRQARQGIRTATYGEYLADLGFADPDRIGFNLDWWVEVMRSRRVDLVIAEFAPCALLAARIVGIPAVCLGTGYSTPPPAMLHFPVLIEDYATLLYDEAELVDGVNRLIVPRGLEAVLHLPELYRADLHLPRTIAALDPYGDHRTGPYLPPFGLNFPHVNPDATEIIVYFSTDEHEDPVLMEALTIVGLPMRVIMPSADDEVADRLAQAGIKVERQPLPHARIAEHAKVMVHAGQHGALCLALCLGLPSLAIPRQLEQVFNARRGQGLGTVSVVRRDERDPTQIAAAIRALYVDADRAARAAALASQLRPQMLGDLPRIVRASVLPLLGWSSTRKSSFAPCAPPC